MNRTRQLCSPIVDRRCFCGSIVGLAVGVIVTKLPSEAQRLSKRTGAGQEYLIVNGWVLSREDFAVAEIMRHVV